MLAYGPHVVACSRGRSDGDRGTFGNSGCLACLAQPPALENEVWLLVRASSEMPSKGLASRPIAQLSLSCVAETLDRQPGICP
jgi:hypothetical protein